jgi:hypothetical protein
VIDFLGEKRLTLVLSFLGDMWESSLIDPLSIDNSLLVLVRDETFFYKIDIPFSIAYQRIEIVFEEWR